MEDQSGRIEPAPYPGNVLVAGCGFIVTGAGWGLFGYLEGEFTATSGAGLFLALAFAHIVTGVLVLSRQWIAFPMGLIVGLTGLLAAVVQPQFVLVFTNVVILVLLLLARSAIHLHFRATGTGGMPN